MSIDNEFYIAFKIKGAKGETLSTEAVVTILCVLNKLGISSANLCKGVENRMQLKYSVISTCIKNKNNLGLFREIKKLFKPSKG